MTRLGVISLVMAALVILGSQHAHTQERDYALITCRAFLGAGEQNMAHLISWLRGYHAGKTGKIPFPSPDPYAGRLGIHCRQHPDANLTEASEQILAELDRGRLLHSN